MLFAQVSLGCCLLAGRYGLPRRKHHRSPYPLGVAVCLQSTLAQLRGPSAAAVERPLREVVALAAYTDAQVGAGRP